MNLYLILAYWRAGEPDAWQEYGRRTHVTDVPLVLTGVVLVDQLPPATAAEVRRAFADLRSGGRNTGQARVVVSELAEVAVRSFVE